MLSIAHDHQLRALLKAHLSARLAEGDRWVDEFSLAYGAARADLALVNGRLEGFEIKAGSDTLHRLPAQVEAYDRVFEHSWVLTTARHLKSVRLAVPAYWGLLVVTSNAGGSAIKQVRQARRHSRRDPAHLVRLLWRDEALRQLEILELSRGLKSKPRIAMFDALVAAMPLDALADYVRCCLKARGDWRLGSTPRVRGGSLHPDAR